MKKNIFLMLFIVVSVSFYGQTGNIGVSTTSPRSTLDINGTMNVNNEINLGGNDAEVGTSGTVGDLISANGAANPEWKKFDLPTGYLDGLILSANYLKSTLTGVSFPGTENGALSVPYTQNQTLPANWKEITGVRENAVKINKTVNIVNISIQTVAQVTGSTGVGSFGCGIYLDGQLKFVRTNNVAGASGSYRILNFNASIPNLTVGNHTVRFACTERNVPTTNTLNIGQPQSTSTTLSSEMAGTSLSIQVLEPIQ